MSSTGWDFGGELPPRDDEQTGPHERAQEGPEFRALRRRMRGFAFPVAAAFLLWYFAYVLLTSYAPDLMATPVLGGINLGLVAGLAQFVTTFALTMAYVRYAHRRLDPLAEQIRTEVEDGPPADLPVQSPPIVGAVIHRAPLVPAPEALRAGTAR